MVFVESFPPEIDLVIPNGECQMSRPVSSVPRNIGIGHIARFSEEKKQHLPSATPEQVSRGVFFDQLQP